MSSRAAALSDRIGYEGRFALVAAKNLFDAQRARFLSRGT